MAGDRKKTGTGRADRRTGRHTMNGPTGRNRRDWTRRTRQPERPEEDASLPDYGTYHLNRREWWEQALVYLVLDGLVGWLFFHSWIACAVGLAGAGLFFREREKTLAVRRRDQLRQQFATGITLVSASLQSGYSIESAFREACPQLSKIYGEDAWMVREFYYICAQLRLNRTIESLLMDLGRRSHVEDILSFAEVFYAAKRTGGDLMTVIHTTAGGISRKMETRREIETAMAGRAAEQKVMSLIPLIILAYVGLTSPAFLTPLYHNAAGILVMAGCLGVYAAAYMWGRKIMQVSCRI